MRPGRLAVLTTAAFLIAAVTSTGRASAATITYAAGYHLVAGPEGTVFRGVAGNLFTLDSASGQYISQSSDQPVHAGVGYFAYFDGLITERMGKDQHGAITVQLPPGQWLLVGNPSAYSSAVISGADYVYAFDQQAGFVVQSSVPAGAGALVYSANGGVATIQPIPGGIDETLSAAEDRLVDAGPTAADVPAGFAMTRAEPNGGNNANVPATYVVEFRPKANPKPSDLQQTTFISINIQQSKDADYAAILYNGSDAGQLRQVFGQNVQSVDAIAAPSGIGDAAKLFHILVKNGNNVAGSDVLFFRRRALFVTVVVLAPNDNQDLGLLTALATTMDGRVGAAFP